MPWKEENERLPIPKSVTLGASFNPSAYHSMKLARDMEVTEPPCAMCGHPFLAHARNYGCTHSECYTEVKGRRTWTRCSGYVRSAPEQGEVAA